MQTTFQDISIQSCHFVSLKVSLNFCHRLLACENKELRLTSDFADTWSPWLPWSLCSENCGGGLRTRTRFCSSGSDQDCVGMPTDTEDCNQQQCNGKLRNVLILQSKAGLAHFFPTTNKKLILIYLQ